MAIDRHLKPLGPAPTGPYQSKYPHRLNFYFSPPLSTIKAEDIEVWALERLQVLKSIESAYIRFKGDDEIRQAVEPTLSAYLPLSSNHNRKANLAAERQKDHVSHFILRLAFSKTAESRSWFLRYETHLFRLRFLTTDFNERQAFLETLPDFQQRVLSPAQKEAIKPELRAASSYVKNFDQESFFEVEFQQVLDLVQRRQVFVRGGKAYVPLSDQGVLIVNEFKKHLEKVLGTTAKVLTRLDDDDRLGPILNNLSSQQASVGYQTKTTNGKVGASEVDTGIGVSLEDAMEYWRKAFRHLSDDKFQKEHAYNIRHNYGLEGKRTNYSPYSCNKIILANHPGPGDHHGCPFRHFSKDQLVDSLCHQNLAEDDIRSIAELAKAGHYQIACTRHFEAVHKNTKRRATESTSAKTPDTANGVKDAGALGRIIHPNQFYDQSVALTQPEAS
ncbi:DNA primase subunit pri2 [Dimargaris verticillata]|uniref:DNA primase subunit pri2 n=1 Tax=Dimargaris verticillata TaxID=2761393 RepID=A0A9W8B1W0_9FUNG|nr:DNA primase subunit pri2 [Dimargaris verticillata]